MLRINLHYGPDRDNVQYDGMYFDHPFARMMPDEITAEIDKMIRLFDTSAPLNVALVEEYPLIYIRYLIRKTILNAGDVHVYWHEDGDRREIRLGDEGELLDPWPGGFFDRSLEFTLGGWR